VGGHFDTRDCKDAIGQMYGGSATLVQSVPVRETQRPRPFADQVDKQPLVANRVM
jgi:hypothetical protein